MWAWAHLYLILSHCIKLKVSHLYGERKNKKKNMSNDQKANFTLNQWVPQAKKIVSRPVIN